VLHAGTRRKRLREEKAQLRAVAHPVGRFI
jgi:hypothetical protein